ncbi:hypothetical protein SAMN00017405_1122 [Desulfonispora thiosulfatigenes DSM 11270]|uniref:Uncharacterized protein n=1 Tax=Desulfonispora thiosulfatigenes DSM 11270 TaxID=656914 RepID=A0A1W1UYG0_DESTI|nr:hypothetical protein [Desulfonispora thiosulfatigenes]SMB86116.1 hypothetical protein SAMN00017405_1122 [Desulfonispora thiosulfatigenes DSM 11270]
MEKARRITVSIVAIIYLLLVFMKIDIPSNVFIAVLGIILLNQSIDEWSRYKETNRKIHLLIPISFLATVVLIVLIRSF